MKSLVFVLSLGLCAGVASAQSVKESDVPNEVKQAYKKDHPNVKVKQWEKDGKNYETEIMLDNKMTELEYDAGGRLVATEVEIEKAELPKEISAYLEKNLPGKKVDEIEKVTDDKGQVTYEAEVNNMDYIFDEKGAFIKKEKKGLVK